MFYGYGITLLRNKLPRMRSLKLGHKKVCIKKVHVEWKDKFSVLLQENDDFSGSKVPIKVGKGNIFAWK